jgi:hypothetical protein
MEDHPYVKPYVNDFYVERKKENGTSRLKYAGEGGSP